MYTADTIYVLANLNITNMAWIWVINFSETLFKFFGVFFNNDTS